MFRVKRYRLRCNPSLYCSRACWNLAKRGQVKNPARRAEIVRLYQQERLTLKQIGDRYEMTPAGVAFQLEQAKVKRRPQNGRSLRSASARAKADANRPRGERHHSHHDIPMDAVIDSYNSGVSGEAIAKQYGVSAITIYRRLRANGVVVRQPGYSRWRTCKDGHVVQSTWEMIVDDWLFSHGITHQVQPRVPFSTRQHADFRVNDTFIEVWGMMTRSSYRVRRANKLAKYAAHGIDLIELFPSHIERHDCSPLHRLLG